MILISFFINFGFHEEVSVSNVKSIMYYEDWDFRVFYLGQVREYLKWGDFWTKSERLKKLS